MLTPEAAAIVEALLAEARTFPWFANVGAPIDPEVQKHFARLKHWSDWKGPEHPSSRELAEEINALSARVDDPCFETPVHPVRLPRESRALARGVWLAAYDPMIRIAGAPLGTADIRPLDPYEPKQTATMQAGFIGALICVYRALGQNDAEPRGYLSWFAKGHWPCGAGKRLIVF